MAFTSGFLRERRSTKAVRKHLCVIVALTLLLCPLLSFAEEEDGISLPWFDLTWVEDTADAEQDTGYIYIGVYPCRYVLDFSGWPTTLSGVLEPVDAERMEGLSLKAVNDCWSFFGVYPEVTTDENTYLFRLDGNVVSLYIEENDIRFTAVAAE